MGTVGFGIFALGFLVVFVAHLWLLVVAFKKSILAGLLVLFIPLWGSILFVCLNWERAKKPFLAYMSGFACFIVGYGTLAMFAPDALEAIKKKSDEADAREKLEKAGKSDSTGKSEDSAEKSGASEQSDGAGKTEDSEK